MIEAEGSALQGWPLDGFSGPAPLHALPAGLARTPGVYVVTCGDSVAHIGHSNKLRRRLHELLNLNTHRGSAEVLCVSYCTGDLPTVRWKHLQSTDAAKAREEELKRLIGEPPRPDKRQETCRKGHTLKCELIRAAGATTWEAGYIEAIFDAGEPFRLLFDRRFESVWRSVRMPLDPWRRLFEAKPR